MAKLRTNVKLRLERGNAVANLVRNSSPLTVDIMRLKAEIAKRNRLLSGRRL